MDKSKSSNSEFVIRNSLTALAEKYERKEFLVGDPSWFMHQIEGDTNKELLAFIASALSYGSRKQFLPKIQLILDHVNATSSGNMSSWLMNRQYDAVIPPHSTVAFYRLYSCQTFNKFLTALRQMVAQYGSIKGYLQAMMQTQETLEAINLITKWFADHDSIGVIPKNTSSSCKRVCMFMRWMVRSGSPVDLGIWSDIIDRRTLIMPMDTHVVQESIRMNLITSPATTMSNALRLTKRLAEIFPDDPTKGDFALFGIGVDNQETNDLH